MVGRLAPTPSGHLHLGNALAFAAAWLSVRQRNGTLLLRIEDVDTGRARESIAQAQRQDLDWLGLHWDRETAPQSSRDYLPWLTALGDRVYRCVCSRKTLRAVAGRCECSSLTRQEGAARFRLEDRDVCFEDRKFGPQQQTPNTQSDPALQRRDGVFAYNLAVVADDIADGVSEVVRGADLLPLTGVQVQIWQAFGATSPDWMHAPLVLDETHRKISKSEGGLGIRSLRDAGWSADDVWRQILPWLGLPPVTLNEAVSQFDATAGPRGPIVLRSPPSHATAPLDWHTDLNGQSSGT